MPHRKPSSQPRLKRVSIRAERRPEPDWDRFAWATLQHSKIVLARRRAEEAKKDRP